VNDLACTAAGDKAKAAYNETFATDLETAKADYETTRTAYRTARHDVRITVDDLRNQVRHLVERIGCQIEQKRVRRCLDDAFCEVLDELKCCPTPDPCCSEDCEYPLDDVEGQSVDELTALITKYQAQLDEAKKCFTDLKGEPDKLRKNVEDAKALVVKITNDLAGDPAKLDLKKAYAEALVAKWKLGRVYGGFRNVQEFVDCLCGALTCWTKGCEAVYKLTGLRAVTQCKDKAKQDHCDKLRNQTAEQILAHYDRLCAKKDCDEPSGGDEGNGGGSSGGDGAGGGGGGGGAGDDDHDDCDCDCHKPRRRHGCGCHDDSKAPKAAG
jgi:predicted  nucleic acid-binding Zn-ribbon protein